MLSNFTGQLNSGIKYIEIDIQIIGDDEAGISHNRDLFSKKHLREACYGDSLRRVRNRVSLG